MNPETKDRAFTNAPPRVLVLFGSGVMFGAERGNLEALMALKSKGSEILCLVRDDDWSTVVPLVLDARGIGWRKVPYLQHLNSIYFLLLSGPWLWLKANWLLLEAIRIFKPTHIHAYGQLFIVNFVLGLWITSVPIVFRAGDEPTLHNWFWRASWKFILSRTAKFVANSEFVSRSLQIHGVQSDRISVIYNFPPTRPNLATGTLRLDLPPCARVIAFVGQIAEHKGPHLLVSGFRSLAAEFPDIYLVLAGRISDWSGDAWGRALRDQTANDDIIADRVMFIGDIEDVPALLARSEVLVVPSLFEDPSPNVVMEAKQAGRACIGFPRGGISELIEDGVDGFICYDATVEALAFSLRKYCENPSMAAQHGSQALYSINRFGHTKFADRWSDIYALARQSKESNC